MDEQSEGFKPPYMSFQTFWNFIGELLAKPLPPQFDRSLMRNKSGTDQNNLLAALQSFELVGYDKDHTVLPLLRNMEGTDDEQRKAILAEMLHKHYGSAVALSEANNTYTALNDLFRDEYNLPAVETRRKCMTFFLHGLRVAGLPVSVHFPATRAGSGGPGTPKPKKAPGTPRKRAVPDLPTQQAQPKKRDDEAHKQTVTLRAGGTMTLTVDVNPLTLRGEDREFFYKVVDALLDYEENAPAPKPAADPEGAVL